MIFWVLNEIMHNKLGFIDISIAYRLCQFKIVVFLMNPYVFGDMVYCKTSKLIEIQHHLTYFIGHHFQIITNGVCQELAGLGVNLVAQFLKITSNPIV